MEIVKATATYSGGGIYIYTGEVDDGSYFLTNDDFYVYVEFLNDDPYKNLDESLNEIWQNAHHLGEYSGSQALEFYKKILRWIIENKPEGNYQVYEIEQRLSKLM